MFVAIFDNAIMNGSWYLILLRQYYSINRNGPLNPNIYSSYIYIHTIYLNP